MRILLVDKDAGSRMALAGMLRVYGKVDLVSDGLSALACFSCAVSMDDPYGIVCLDIPVSDMDEMSLSESMRKLESDSGIPAGQGAKLVIMGVKPAKEDGMQDFQSKQDAFLVKPCSPRKVKKLLGKLGIPAAVDPTERGGSCSSSSDDCPRVLIVDDLATNIFLLSHRVREAGLGFKVAWNGAEALERLEDSGDFSIVLMDCQMPVMDGREAISKIRNSGKCYSKVRVLCTSSKHSSDGSNGADCKGCGADGYLCRSSGRDGFIAAISKIQIAHELEDSSILEEQAKPSRGSSCISQRS